MQEQPTTVAIIGAGASGAVTALALLERWGSRGGALRLQLIDPSPATARGVAYATEDPGHLLNVPASRMSVRPGDPAHFTRWLASNHGVHDESAYVPRGWFGEYLEASLEGAMASSRVEVQRIHAAVVDLHRQGDGYRLQLASGAQLGASHVVLALGGGAGPAASLPEALLTSPRFIADPWAPGALEAAREQGGELLLLGQGLTAVDVALSLARPGSRVTAVSRRGLLPRSHPPKRSSRPSPPELPPGRMGLAEVETLVRERLDQAAAQGEPWQLAMDSLRPITNELWGRLDLADQRAFLEGPMRSWEVARHRMAPEVAARFAQLRCAGRLDCRAASVLAAEDGPHGLEVRLSDGTRKRFNAVISCTGPGGLRASTGPIAELVEGLERSGLARIHELGLGLEVDGQGRVLGGSCPTGQPIYVVGPLRRGRLWETTAIPEITQQAWQVADDLLADLATRRNPGSLLGDLSGLAAGATAVAS